MQKQDGRRDFLPPIISGQSLISLGHSRGKKSFPKSYSATVTPHSEIQLPCTVIVGGFFGDEGKDDANRPLEAR